MSCYHPITVWQFEKGKPVSTHRCGLPIEVADQFKIQIPCGQCAGCRLDRANDWAIRCVIESRKFEDNWFVTLTYDDAHVPMDKKPWVDYSTGEITDVFTSSLCPDHLKKFLKDLRRYFEYHYNHFGIRFIGCGEYGEENKRPHYHLILFNLPLDDLKFSHRSNLGFPNFRSQTLESIWKKGMVTVGYVNYSSCGYVARYCLKAWKHNKDRGKDPYEVAGLQRPFFRCSMRPGIARDFYDSKKDWIYSNDEIFVPTSDGALSVKPPAYFDRLFRVDDPERLMSVKDARRDLAKIQKEESLLYTDVSAEDYVKVQENNRFSRISALKRK